MIPANEVGVIGDRGIDGHARIEFRFGHATEATRPVLLGDGNFAQVYDGQLRIGLFTLSLAIKVQRTMALNREAFRAVEAKFDAEKATHVRLRKNRPDKEEYPIVELVDWGTSEPHEPIRFASTILCPHARHSLIPRCSQCGAELGEDPWTTDQNERALSCPSCSARFGESEENKSRIRAATVRKDPACQGCSKSDIECQRSADFFNFFPTRVLLFERQELDLDTYLTQSAVARDRRIPLSFWSRRIPAEDPFAELGERLDILSQVLDSVAYLHGRSVAHLDLKPKNFCVRIEAGRVRICVIDLGLAEDAQTVEYLRQAGGDMQLNSSFAPPEMKESAKRYVGTYTPTKPRGKFVLAKSPTDMSGNPAILVGDEVEVRVAGGQFVGQGRIQSVAVEAGFLIIDWQDSPEDVPAQSGEILIRKQRGLPADLYSFGMLILSILSNEAEPAAYQDSLGTWTRAIAETPGNGANTSEVWESLRRDEVFGKLDKDLQRYGACRGYAEDAIGIALKLVCRSSDGRCIGHMKDRSQNALRVLFDLVQRWRALASAFEDSAKLNEADRIRQRMKRLLPMVEATLRNTTPPRGKNGTESVSVAPSTVQTAAIEKALLDYEKYPDPTSRESVFENLRKLYKFQTEPLLADLRRYVDPQLPPPLLPLAPAIVPLVPVEVKPKPSILEQHENTVIDAFYFALAPAIKVSRSDDWKQFCNDRNSIERWKKPTELLCQYYNGYTVHLNTLSEFIFRIDHLVLHTLRTKLKRNENDKTLKAHEFELERSHRLEIDEDAASHALLQLGRLVEQSKAVYEHFRTDANLAYSRWNTLPQKLKMALQLCRDRLIQRVQKLKTEQTQWVNVFPKKCQRLEQFFGGVSNYLLRAWDAESSRKGLFEILGMSGRKPYTKVSLGYELVEEIPDPLEILNWMREFGLGPAVETYAGILWEYRRDPSK